MAIVNAVIPDELKRSLDIAVAQKDISIKNSVEEAIRQWLGEGKRPEPVDYPELEEAREIMDSGHEVAIAALRSNLKAFLDLVRGAGHKRRAG